MMAPRLTTASCAQRVVEAVGARERDPVTLADAVLVGEHRRDRAARAGTSRERHRLIGEH